MNKRMSRIGNLFEKYVSQTNCGKTQSETKHIWLHEFTVIIVYDRDALFTSKFRSFFFPTN